MIRPCIFVLIFLCQINFSIEKPLDGQSRDCPGGLESGAQLERGRFFYECRDGNLEPKGCITDDLKHVEIGATMDRPRYRLKCNLGSDRLLAWEPVACLLNGGEYKADEQFENGNNFYVCKRENDGLRSINSGCLDGGRRINLNDKIVKDDFVLICNETVNNGARLMQVGCVKDGRQYNAGESFDAGDFWYNCTRTGREKVAVKAAGCLHDGRRLKDGDRTFDNDVIRECRIDTAKNEMVTIGCAEKDENGELIERTLGCIWVEGNIEIMCSDDSANRSAKKTPLRCQHKTGSGEFNLEPGCYRLIEKVIYGCIDDGSQRLRFQTFDGESGESAAKSAGLHAC